MNERPDPPVAFAVDLRDFPFTPIFRSRLFGSSFHARVSDAEWRAGVTLWLKSWDQVPAGSLPDDDVDLCRLAELGRDVKVWRKLRQGALHGWFTCSDGRLYHKVVAEGVNEAWQRKQEQRDRTEKARAAKLAKKLAQSGGASVTDPVTDGVTGSVTDTVTGSKGQGQGQGQGYIEPSLRDGAAAPPRSLAEEVKAALFGPCLRYLAGSMPDDKARSMIGKWRRDFGDVDTAAAIAEAEKAAASQPLEFIIGVLQRRRSSRGRPDPNAPPRLATAI